ncbi:MAG: hypothetical protein E6R03_10675 [Hyphomicrobiaceae bacterium]|nr:MAG: hypothetical protein E6R03_10675 [Hyphomicrobiaceae bacterium]
MAYYVGHDIETDDAGEVQFENGDIKLASTKRTFLQGLNWMIMSSRTESSVPDAMAHLVVYKGRLNIANVHRSIETSIRQAALYQNLFDPNDLDVRVVPIATDAASLTVKLKGVFLEDRLEDQDDPIVSYQTLGYVFPFESATPERVV